MMSTSINLRTERLETALMRWEHSENSLEYVVLSYQKGDRDTLDSEVRVATVCVQVLKCPDLVSMDTRGKSL